MKQEEIENLTNSIRNKIGEENSALISEELVNIISDNNNMNTEISNKNQEIQNLTESKQYLLETNGKLFQQIGLGLDKKEDIVEENKKNFRFSDVFDEKGNFKK